MSRYIDAAALGIGKANRDVFENKAYADGWNAAIGIIASAPTADVAEVVRCKDCKYLHSDAHGGYCVFRGLATSDDFCSFGERNDENEQAHDR